MMRGIVTFVFRKRQSHDASATVQVFKMMKGHTRHSPEQGCCCCCCCCCCRRRRRRRRHRWPLPPPPFSDRTHSLTRLQPPLAMTIMALFSMLSRRPNAEQCVPLPPPPSNTHPRRCDVPPDSAAAGVHPTNKRPMPLPTCLEWAGSRASCRPPCHRTADATLHTLTPPCCTYLSHPRARAPLPNVSHNIPMCKRHVLAPFIAPS